MFSGVHLRESMTRSWQVMQTSEGKEMRLYHFISWREIIWWILVPAASMKTSWIFLKSPARAFLQQVDSRTCFWAATRFWSLFLQAGSWTCRKVLYPVVMPLGLNSCREKKQQEPIRVHPLDFHHKDSLWCITSCIPEFTKAMPFNKNSLPHTSSSSD